MAFQFAGNPSAVSTIAPRHAARESAAGLVYRWHVHFWQLVSVWKRRSRDRAALRALGPQAIHDFCPRQTEAETEMSKPFWRA